MMLQLQIEAFDTFFFRDGRPFTMGADTTATGPFPPSPQVVYGAIRSAMAAQEGMKQEDIDRLTKSVKMVDFGLFTHGSRYYPAPLDILLPKSDPKNQPIGFVPTTMLGAASSCISNGGQSPDYWLYSDDKSAVTISAIQNLANT
jgi:CRISPR/Cas system CMR-associated protein Cmr3 (group 5 of RAMP superfamily)